MADEQFTDKNEEWRDAPGWPLYQVSSHGRLRSLHYGLCKIRKQHRNASGYLTAALSNGTIAQTVRIHRLVCEAFHGPAPEGKPEVAHWDGARDNNHFTNLRWASHKENFSDQLRHGTFTAPPNPLGTGRLSSEDLANIAAMKAAGHRTAVIAALFEVHRRTVNRIYRTGRP